MSDGLTKYLELFRGREDYLAQQGDDSYCPIRASLSKFHLERHFAEDVTFGLYVLNKESACHLVCIDVDIPKAEIDTVDISNRVAKYEYLSPQLDELCRVLEGDFDIAKDSLLLEETGGRGYHIWLFLTVALSGDLAVAFGRALKNRLSFETEFFPKQGSLGPKRKFGNLIKLPLGIHQRYGFRSSFFTVCEGVPKYLDGLDENLTFLGEVPLIDSSLLERVAEGFQEELKLDQVSGASGGVIEVIRVEYEGDSDQLLANCTAMRLIAEKASRGEQLSRSEAFHFVNVLLPLQDGERQAHESMRSAYGENYTFEHTQREIEGIRPLSPTSCKSLVNQGFCPEYCKKSVAKRNEDPLMKNTNPCSVWLRRRRPGKLASDFCIGSLEVTPEAVESAFFRLRQYHEHEDSLFYDPFDFDNFAGSLNSLAQVIANSLCDKIDLPLAGYLSVSIPKKLDEGLGLCTREMAYSTVFDQVPIQAVFDAISPKIEVSFRDSSYGYRWNQDKKDPSRIFEDWRDTYPRFRSSIMSAIQMNPDGFHICCDIKGYYDHVNHDNLLAQLRNIVDDDYVLQFLERVVRLHEAGEGTGCGLPQGPAYARLLANLYLTDFDAAVEGMTVGYYRYVDDFFLIFDSRIAAEQGLTAVVNLLSRLGLELSDDEKKKAIIESNMELGRIRKSLDKIQYGILEGTRQIQHLEPEVVSDFYSAVERQSGSPASAEQLVKINDALPSLLYVVSQETLIPHDFKKTLWDTVDYLIRHRWFCPKRLKMVFHRLLVIAPDKMQFVELFGHMEPAHRVYFLLSVFGGWKADKSNGPLLKALVPRALSDDDPFVQGFAAAISVEFEVTELDDALVTSVANKMTDDGIWFPLVRVLGTYDYASLTDDQRAVIRRVITKKSPDFLKLSVINNLAYFPATYLDVLYFSGLLTEFRILLVPSVVRMLALATDWSELLNVMVDFLASTPSYKSICVSLVMQAVRDKRSSSGIAEIMNLQSLYNRVSDDELRNTMISVVTRINDRVLSPDMEFIKVHQQVDSYNGCYLFERTDGNVEYQFLELIPEDRFRESLQIDYDGVLDLLADLASKGVVPPNKFSSDSGRKEAVIRLSPRAGMLSVQRGVFPMTPQAISDGLRVASDTFKKAAYFRRVSGKAPLVVLANLLIDRTACCSSFHTIGRSMTTPFVVSGITIGEENADIAFMISLLLQEMFFPSDEKARDFIAQESHSPHAAFLAHVIRNMSAKDPSHRYSLERLEYLAGAFSQCLTRSEKDLSILYLLERLKAGLFRHNPEMMTWQGACSALDRHVSDVRVLFDKETLSRAKIENRVLGLGRLKWKLHWLSRQMLNLSLNRDCLLVVNSARQPYLDLIEYLLLYAVLCVESVSLCRAIWGKRLLDSTKYHCLLDFEEVTVTASVYEETIPSSDFAALFTYRSDGTGSEIRDLSLRQIALLALLACGSKVGAGHVHIEKPLGLTENQFDNLVHACLFRVPRAESEAHAEFERITETLRSGDDIDSGLERAAIREDVDVIAADFTRLRRRMKLTRYCGWADGKKWPEKVICKSKFRKALPAKEEVIPSMALVNSYPASRYRCSWDVTDGEVSNLLVASASTYSFLMDLMGGSALVRKLLYIYRGRLMLIWDVFLLVGFSLLLFLSILGKAQLTNDEVKAACEIAGVFLAAVALGFGGKIVFRDLRYWTPLLKKGTANKT